MPWQQSIGYLAGILTTIAVIPQIAKVWKTRAMEDISVSTLIILVSGLSLWTVYGFVNSTWPIIIPNGIALLLNCFLLVLVFHEKRQQR